MEDHRKDAKRLLRSFRGAEIDALRRAESVLGARARERFLLSDALHVVAVEHGYRTWPELVRETSREELVAGTGLEYAPGDPVLVKIVRRGRRASISDEGAAVERAGRLPGWRDVAGRVTDDLIVNVSRHGAVWLPLSPRGCGPGEEEIVHRIGEASLALYQDLLDLE